MDSLLQKQKFLQERALSVINRLRLDDILAKYGEYYLTGSVVYGTVWRRDIDYKLKLNEHNTSSLFSLSREIFDAEGVYTVHAHNITGFRDMEGYTIKASLTDVYAEKWNVDIMIEATRFKTDKQFNQNMQLISEDERQIIMEIKSGVFEEEKDYRDLSPMIYKAVIEEGVTDRKTFEAYLKKSGKTIKDFERSNS